MSESALASMLGISRTPVREAILELASEGLLDYLNFGGARVHVVTELEQEEIFLLRQTLEVLAVERLSVAASSEDLERLQAILDRQALHVDDEDRSGFLELDQQFHLKLAELAGLRLTQRILRNIRDMFYLMGLAAVKTKGRSAAVVAEHRRVLDAIRAKDAEGAARAICQHLSRTQEAINALPLPASGRGGKHDQHRG